MKKIIFFACIYHKNRDASLGSKCDARKTRHSVRNASLWNAVFYAHTAFSTERRIPTGCRVLCVCRVFYRKTHPYGMRRRVGNVRFLPILCPYGTFALPFFLNVFFFNCVQKIFDLIN